MRRQARHRHNLRHHRPACRPAGSRHRTGDEVITSPFTFIASANSILYTGARPVFVDIDPLTFNLDPALIEAAITPRTKAILPVHLFGLSCDMDAILDIAEKHHLRIIEDACQSHGATYQGKRVGSFGIGTFSFYPTKNMTSAEGGMITTDDDLIAEECRVIRQHGMRRRYYHDELGFNFRMTDVHAAIGLEQLKKLESAQRPATAQRPLPERASAGRERAPRAQEAAPTSTTSTPCVCRAAGATPCAHSCRRTASARRSTTPCRSTSRLSTPKSWATISPCREAEKAAAEVLSLPVHPALTQSDLELIVARVNEFITRRS